MNQYTVGQAATLLGSSSPTIRRWAGIFKDYLSAGANPGVGEARLFTDSDIELMAWIRERLTLKRTYEALLAELARGTVETPSIEELVVGDAGPSELVAAEEQTAWVAMVETLQEMRDSMQGMREDVDSKIDVDRRIDAVERRLDVIESVLEVIQAEVGRLSRPK